MLITSCYHYYNYYNDDGGDDYADDGVDGGAFRGPLLSFIWISRLKKWTIEYFVGNANDDEESNVDNDNVSDVDDAGNNDDNDNDNIYDQW